MPQLKSPMPHPFPVIREWLPASCNPVQAIPARSACSAFRAPPSALENHPSRKVPVMRGWLPAAGNPFPRPRQLIPSIRDVGPVVRAAVPVIRDVAKGQNSTVLGFREAGKGGVLKVRRGFCRLARTTAAGCEPSFTGTTQLPLAFTSRLVTFALVNLAPRIPPAHALLHQQLGRVAFFHGSRFVQRPTDEGF